MAQIGVKYIVGAVVAKYERGIRPVLADGFVIGRAIAVDKTITFADNPLYADDMVAENEKTFDSGTLSIKVDDISLEHRAKMYGHNYVADPVNAEDATGMLEKGGADQPPYMSIGYYKTKIYRGVRSYEVTIIHKVKFSPPSESASTKERSITWGTPTTEGSIELLEGFENDLYEDTYSFSAEEAARSFIQTTFGITDVTNGS